MNVFRRSITAALVVCIAAGLTTINAGASVRTPSLSSVIVPPPHGWHENQVAYGDELPWDNLEVPHDSTGGRPTGAQSFLEATSSECNGIAWLLSQSQWVGSEVRYFGSVTFTGNLLVCVTRLLSAWTATTVAREVAATYAVYVKNSLTQEAGTAGLVTVSGIPRSTGFWFGQDSGLPPIEEDLTYAEDRYIVFVQAEGPGPVAKRAQSLARQQYERLR